MTCCGISVNQWKKWRGLENVRACPKCGLGMQYPMPTEKDLAAIYSENYYDSWGGGQEKEIYWEMKKELYRKLIQTCEMDQKKGRLLDVGCATGACLEVAQEMEWRVYGIDVNAHAIEMIKKQIPHAEVQCGHLEEARFENDSFDIVVMSDVLEHVANPKSCLTRVGELLKTGGVVVILTPNINSLSAMLMGKKWLHIKQEHLYYFSRKAICGLLKEVGFNVFKQKTFWKPLTLKYATMQFQQYPTPFITPMINFLKKHLPDPIQKKIFWIPMGEMLICGRKTLDN